jgi:hypothetical protein
LLLFAVPVVLVLILPQFLPLFQPTTIVHARIKFFY